MVGLVANLGVCEAKRREACSGMGLVSQPVAGLLGRGTVVAQAVGLHDRAEIRPEEVDLEPVYEAACLRLR